MLFNRIASPNMLRAFAPFVIALMIAASSVFVLPKKADAQTIPFGGRSLNVRWCACSMNLMVTVGPPVGGVYMYQPGATMLYLFGQIYRSGVWLLGLAGGMGQCWVPCKGCCYAGGGPTMLIVGTSM